jgi:hypothetical protein
MSAAGRGCRNADPYRQTARLVEQRENSICGSVFARIVASRSRATLIW